MGISSESLANASTRIGDIAAAVGNPVPNHVGRIKAPGANPCTIIMHATAAVAETVTALSLFSLQVGLTGAELVLRRGQGRSPQPQITPKNG